jgi:hypothetical protein
MKLNKINRPNNPLKSRTKIVNRRSSIKRKTIVPVPLASIKPVTMKPVIMKPVIMKPMTMKRASMKPVTMKRASMKPMIIKPANMKQMTMKVASMKPASMKPAILPIMISKELSPDEPSADDISMYEPSADDISNIDSEIRSSTLNPPSYYESPPPAYQIEDAEPTMKKMSMVDYEDTDALSYTDEDLNYRD